MTSALPDKALCPVCGKDESLCDYIKVRCPQHGVAHATLGGGVSVGDMRLEVPICHTCGSHEVECRCQRCQVPRCRDAVLHCLYDLDQRGEYAADVTELADNYDDGPFTEQGLRTALVWLCDQGLAAGDRGHQGSVVFRPRITPAGRLYAQQPAVF